MVRDFQISLSVPGSPYIGQNLQIFCVYRNKLILRRYTYVAAFLVLFFWGLWIFRKGTDHCKTQLLPQSRYTGKAKKNYVFHYRCQFCFIYCEYVQWVIRNNVSNKTWRGVEIIGPISFNLARKPCKTSRNQLNTNCAVDNPDWSASSYILQGNWY